MMFRIKFIQEIYSDEIRMKSLKVNASLNVIKTLMGIIFPLITFPYASRILLPEGIGKVNFANSIISYFAIISSLGIETYAIREAARLRDNKNQLSQFAKEIFTINIFSTIIAYIILFAAIILIPKFSEYKKLLYITSATILFTTLGMNWLYTAVEDYLYITIRSILFQFICLILLFVFVKDKDDFVIYAAISVFSNVGSNIFNFIHSRKYLKLKTGIPIEIKKHLKPIFVLFAMTVTVKIYTALDTTMLGFIKGDFEVGIYTTATKINKIVLTLVVSIGSVLLPRLSYYSKLDDKKEFFALVQKGFDILFLLAIPCMVGLSLLSNHIVHILSGAGYESAIIPMRIMNPIIIIIGISNFIGIQIFMPLNKEKWTLISVIIGALTNFTLNIILIPKYGAIGAAIATVFGESLVTIVQICLLKKIINLKPVLFSFISYALNSALIAIVVILCRKLIQHEILQLFASIILASCMYFILLLIEKNKFIYEILEKFYKKKDTN